MIQNNPFVIYGYESKEYFCDREEETGLRGFPVSVFD